MTVHTTRSPDLNVGQRLSRCLPPQPITVRQQSARLCAIKTQKQISHGVPHSQREQAPPPVLFTVVKHMATLAKGLQISQPVIGGIMVKVRGRQRYPG